MDIAAWLRSLSLERYARAFRNHANDTEILPASRRHPSFCSNLKEGRNDVSRS
jgi:hypothetical protein